MAHSLRLHNRHTGEILNLRRARDPGGREVLLIDGSLPPKSSGPPPHAHLHQLEEGSVKSGTLGTRIGSKRATIPAGGTASFPAGVVHAWWNAGDDLLELQGRAVPAGDLDRYLQAVFAAINASPSGRPSLFHFAHIAWRHRHTQVLARPPRPVQWILFPIVLLLGRLLGKFRGDDWPGSPASCLGAPSIDADNP